jgi:putative ABC transport system substrate-binding protein
VAAATIRGEVIMQRITRRALLVFSILCCVGAVACAIRPSSRLPVIGYVADANAEPDRLAAFRDGLRELGFIEGRDFKIDYELAHDPDDYPKLVSTLVARGVDVLLAGNAAATRAARAATTTLPVVMAAVNDPVGMGVVQSLEHPGANITGTTNFVPRSEELRLQLLHELAPEVTRVGMPLNPDNPNNFTQFERLASAAVSLHIIVQQLPFRGPDELPAALSSAVASGVQGLVPAMDNLLTTQRVRVVEFAANTHLDAVYADREWVLAGGLISLGSTHTESYRRAAEYVVKVLHGARPSDLAIGTPSRVIISASRSGVARRGRSLPAAVHDRVDEWLP